MTKTQVASFHQYVQDNYFSKGYKVLKTLIDGTVVVYHNATGQVVSIDTDCRAFVLNQYS